jgi:hypothetical protein
MVRRVYPSKVFSHYPQTSSRYVGGRHYRPVEPCQWKQGLTIPMESKAPLKRCIDTGHQSVAPTRLQAFELI